MVPFVKGISKAHTFVSVHSHKLVRPVIDFFFKHLKLVTLRRFLL